MTRRKNYHSDFFGTSGYFYSHCTPEEFIAKCRNDIAVNEERVARLLDEKQKVEKQNSNIDLIRKSSLFAQISLIAFDVMLFLSGHWVWGFLMVGIFTVPIYVGISEIEYSFLCDKEKEDTVWYDEQIAEERRCIEQLNEEIKLVSDMLRARSANGKEHENQNNADGRSGTSGRSGEGQKTSDYQQRRNSAISITDCYAILYCSPNASDSEIRTAYRKLVREYHPDRVSATGLGEHITHDAEEKIKQINEAYRIIMKYRGK